MGTVAAADTRPWRLVLAAWLVALASSLASLFFSEVMGLTPCILCWYQRIFMFPLVMTLGIGLLWFDNGAVKYSLPLAVLGGGIAVYHCLLYVGLIPESIQPCSQGVSCADVQSQSLGSVPIPLLSLVAFSVIGALLVIARKRGR